MRILNYPRLLAVIGLCGLGNLAGLSADIGNLSFISFALAQHAALTTSQSDALNAYNKTVQDFRAILSERRAQINSHQKLPDVPGQALYLARVSMMGAYKDLTDVLPSRIGRPAIQSLDRCEKRPHERARGPFPENTGNHEILAGPDRSNEIF